MATPEKFYLELQFALFLVWNEVKWNVKDSDSNINASCIRIKIWLNCS